MPAFTMHLRVASFASRLGKNPQFHFCGISGHLVPPMAGRFHEKCALDGAAVLRAGTDVDKRTRRSAGRALAASAFVPPFRPSLDA
jgi:hypothetical protein